MVFAQAFRLLSVTTCKLERLFSFCQTRAVENARSNPELRSHAVGGDPPAVRADAPRRHAGQTPPEDHQVRPPSQGGAQDHPGTSCAAQPARHGEKRQTPHVSSEGEISLHSRKISFQLSSVNTFLESINDYLRLKDEEAALSLSAQRLEGYEMEGISEEIDKVRK